MKRNKDWHERDTFWKNVEPILFHQQRLNNTADEVEKVLSLVGIKPGGQVLDLCCGVGRHSLELARRGFEVTGIDITERYLKKAKALAKKEKLKIKFITADMKIFLRKNRFDAVFNLFTSFGFFADQKDDYKVASNAYKSLKGGGVLIMDMIGKEALARYFRPRDWIEYGDTILLEERQVCDNWSRVHNKWTIIKDGRRKTEELDLRLYGGSELKTLLTDCGFKHVDVYGNLNGDPYDDTAQRLVVAARK